MPGYWDGYAYQYEASEEAQRDICGGNVDSRTVAANARTGREARYRQLETLRLMAHGRELVAIEREMRAIDESKD